MISSFLMNLQLQPCPDMSLGVRRSSSGWMSLREMQHNRLWRIQTQSYLRATLAWALPGLMKPKAVSVTFVLWQKELYFNWPRKEYLSCLEQHLVYQVEATGNRLKALCSEILPPSVRSRKQMSWVKSVTFYLFFFCTVPKRARVWGAVISHEHLSQ